MINLIIVSSPAQKTSPRKPPKGMTVRTRTKTELHLKLKFRIPLYREKTLPKTKRYPLERVGVGKQHREKRTLLFGNTKFPQMKAICCDDRGNMDQQQRERGKEVSAMLKTNIFIPAGAGSS